MALLSGEVPPFTPPFAAVTSAGRNLDFPIPFRRRAKVTVEGDAGAYYWQVIYRRYQAGADVRTFTMDQVPELGAFARQLDGEAPGGAEERCLRARDQELVIPAHPGGSEIVELAILPGDRGARALRETILSLSFDGRETARVPLGDFFGAGPGYHPHRTLPLEATGDGWLVSRFVMPFRCAAVVRVLGSPSQTVWLSARHRPAPFSTDTLHFFAQWIARGPVPTRPFRDLTVADVRGRGNYVGTMLAMDSRVIDWWGEGDEKVWVDDEASPRWFGTGTEDYFGYALGTRKPYDHPMRLLARTGLLTGQVASARVHLLDAIPFEASLRFDLELFHWNQDTTVFFDTLAWFYAAPDAENLLPPPAASEFRLPRSR
jgi:hypothetical protein